MSQDPPGPGLSDALPPIATPTPEGLGVVLGVAVASRPDDNKAHGSSGLGLALVER